MLKLEKSQAHWDKFVSRTAGLEGEEKGEGEWRGRGGAGRTDKDGKLSIFTSKKRTQNFPFTVSAHKEKCEHKDHKLRREGGELHVFLQLGRQDFTLISTRQGCPTRGSPETEAKVHRP